MGPAQPLSKCLSIFLGQPRCAYALENDARLDGRVHDGSLTVSERCQRNAKLTRYPHQSGDLEPAVASLEGLQRAGRDPRPLGQRRSVQASLLAPGVKPAAELDNACGRGTHGVIIFDP
jgi:hypothetical protein